LGRKVWEIAGFVEFDEDFPGNKLLAAVGVRDSLRRRPCEQGDE
jgi:hypothetical protein